MAETWLIPAAILLAFALIFFLPLTEVLLSVVRRVRYTCPVAGEEVSVHLVRRTAFGIVGPQDVCACSAFEDPDNPTCGKECLGVLVLPQRG